MGNVPYDPFKGDQPFRGEPRRSFNQGPTPKPSSGSNEVQQTYAALDEIQRMYAALEQTNQNLSAEKERTRELEGKLTIANARLNAAAGAPVLNNKIEQRNLLAFLQDFTLTPEGMQAWATAKRDALFAISDHVLWSPEDGIAYVVRPAHQHALVMLPRCLRGGRLCDCVGGVDADPLLITCQERIMDVEYPIQVPWVPRRVLVVGEIWVRDSKAKDMPPQYSSTNFYLTVDVEKLHKPLWIMYAYEYLSSTPDAAAPADAAPDREGLTRPIIPRRYQLRERQTFQDIISFDVARLSFSVYDTIDQGNGPELDPRVVIKNLNTTGGFFRPTFTESSFTDLNALINHMGQP
ncbi:hypothetical protein F4820DRAFT_78718 [Hypoxylon rubiginosum]|uniref:Uncharacterized protein n=1 Tax=Hypoxylon rubiginosum TaxID=110542 RepID=A0ACB9ZB14_9PEZI|nr:hypothetical protein F4820DRAFT_78718 [Hypoxylon rubiginosum]